MITPGIVSKGAFTHSALTNPWNIGQATYDNKTAVVEDHNSYSINPDGIGESGRSWNGVNNNDAVVRFDFGTAWDLSTLAKSVTNVELDVSSETLGGLDHAWGDEGHELYVSDFDTVFQYHCPTAYAAGTGSLVYQKSFTVQSYTYQSVNLNNDGTKMYINMVNAEKIYEYNLSTPWKVSSASYSGNFFDTSLYANSVNGNDFSPDGSMLFLTDTNPPSAGEYIRQFHLRTPWEIDTAHDTGLSFDTSNEENDPVDICWKDDGTKFYVLFNNGQLHQYSTT